MSEYLCPLCNRELTDTPDPTNQGFWAVTVEDSDNPGVATAHPVHTSCIRENYPEQFEFALRERLEIGTRPS